MARGKFFDLRDYQLAGWFYSLQIRQTYPSREGGNKYALSVKVELTTGKFMGGNHFAGFNLPAAWLSG